MTRVLVHVWLDGRDVKAANLYTAFRRGRLTSVFGYEPDYLAGAGAYALDPSLPLTPGSWPSPGTLPRALLDAAPDRWGRGLIAKREAAAAREAGRAPRTLDDSDFLLGAADATRQGALRFALTPGGAFQHPEPQVPRLVELPGLLRAADLAARDGAESEAAAKALLGAGTGSLGGARPKAAVRDGSRLLIAKFPHAADHWDVMAWEVVALDLARSAGIATPDTRLVDVGGASVLLSTRFDRLGAARLGYISALTVAAADDAAQTDYLRLAQALATVSAEPSRDLADLWRRIALSVALHNTDDHLRNMGLLHVRGGWRLAPAFDLNPDPAGGTARATPLGGAATTADTAAALVEHAGEFGLSAGEARRQTAQVATAVAGWERAATARGLDRPARERFRPVFEAGVAALNGA
ncbi:MAG: HipA domain-containing protein [Propionibacteriaceae bacterium]|jgi:serine/threonine-protein kinase HipA|nr:HipA domain-containing protein [Propionibacteriaceae bacterium]